MINQLNANTLDGNCNQLYLRVHTETGILSTPMIDSNSESEFYAASEQLTWQGKFSGVVYQVNFKLAKDGTWFWQSSLFGDGQKVDLVYGQDIGNAAKAAVRANEAYASQYIDHHVTQSSDDIVISSRQNQPQTGCFPLVEQGALTALVGYSTDGYQFFGRDYKATNTPKALKNNQLANEVYQYEFAYIALQTKQFVLGESNPPIIFYGVAVDDQQQAVTQPVVSKEKISHSYDSLDFTVPKVTPVKFNKKLETLSLEKR